MHWFLYDRDLLHERVNIIRIYGQQNVISKSMTKFLQAKNMTKNQERPADVFRRIKSKTLRAINSR